MKINPLITEQTISLTRRMLKVMYYLYSKDPSAQAKKNAIGDALDYYPESMQEVQDIVNDIENREYI